MTLRPIRVSGPVSAAAVRTIARAVLALAILLPGRSAALSAQPAPQGAVAGLAEPPIRYDADLLPPEFHRGRRAALLSALPEDAVAVVLSAPERTRENDVSFEYRQDSDLYYLSGAHEPGTVLLLAPAGIEVDGVRVTEVLLVPPREPSEELWTGRRFGAERAQQELGVDKAITIERFESILDSALRMRRLFHLPLPEGVAEGSALDVQLEALGARSRLLELPAGIARTVVPRLLGAGTEEEVGRLRNLARYAASRLAEDGPETEAARRVVDAFLASGSAAAWREWKRANVEGTYADGSLLRARLDALRSVKTEPELALLRKAIDITIEAHREAFRSIEPGMHEYEVEAVAEYVFRRNGSEQPGFPSIIGSGENSVILHYEANRRRMEAGDLVVMDIGAEYHGYSADVTRTAPVSGTFTAEQRAIYDLVLRAQTAAIAEVRAGRPFAAPHQAAERVLLAGMRDLGLARDEEELERFFMHGTSHYLGLWVHDVGSYGLLEAGNVITVEPGIYIAPSPDLDPKWWNIGVRIEDDVLVTDGDPVVLSAAAPRTVEEIEATMRETGVGNAEAGRVR